MRSIPRNKSRSTRLNPSKRHSANEVPKAGLEGRLIFIVDDELLGIETLREFLEREGCRVVGSDDPKQMARLLEINRPDLLLSDVMMPGLDGWELLRRMRDTKPNRDTPVIFLTGLATEADESHFTKGHGRCHLLAKPVTYERLIACVREALGSV